jgi:hypothetical protein
MVLLDKLFSAKVLCSDAPFSKAGIQNIMVVLRHAKKPVPALDMVKAKAGSVFETQGAIFLLQRSRHS